MGYPDSWMVYNGKSYENWMIWGAPILGNLHMFCPFGIIRKHPHDTKPTK
jgi:hypothetical protein